MGITDWPADERPRERLLQHGAGALSDAELLAIFLRTGMPGKSAVDLARELIGHFSSLARLFSATQAEFSERRDFDVALAPAAMTLAHYSAAASAGTRRGEMIVIVPSETDEANLADE